MFPAGHGFANTGIIDIRRPVNWQCPMNAGLRGHYQYIPAWRSQRVFRDLTRRNDGTLTGGAVLSNHSHASGMGSVLIGGNGSNDYVNLGLGSIFDNIGSFSFMAWICPSAVDSANTIVACGDHGSNYTFFFAIGTSYGTPDGITTQLGGIGGVDVDVQSVVDEWMHYGMSWDGSTIKVFKNGVLQGSASGSGTSRSNNKTNRIGDYGGLGLEFDGYIDDVRYYPSVCLPDKVFASVYSLSR